MTTLQRQLDALHDDRAAVLALLADAAPSLHRRPDDKSWSPLEILEHIVIAEREVLQDLPDIAQIPRRRRRWFSRLRLYSVMFVLRRRIDVRVPSPGMVPSGGTSLDDLRAQWAENHDWLATYIDQTTEADRANAAFGHPVTGALPLKEAVDLLRVHLESHRQQLDDTLARVAAPTD